MTRRCSDATKSTPTRRGTCRRRPPRFTRRGTSNSHPAESSQKGSDRLGLLHRTDRREHAIEPVSAQQRRSVERANTLAAQAERLRSHIEAVAGRYAGRVHAWDVVNEVIDNDGSYRPTVWVNSIGDGDELVKLAFRFAAEYAPDTELYYNDFNAWRPAKRDGIMRLVRMLQAEGIRIDGVGVQAHWGLNYPKMEYIEAAIDSFATLGVKVMLTELDVDVLPFSKEGQIVSGPLRGDPQFELEEFEEFLDPYKEGLPSDVEKELTDRYRELFSLLYRKRDVIDRVTFWGVHDGMSWKNEYPVERRTNYPLLFDRDRQPKPAFEAVMLVPGME